MNTTTLSHAEQIKIQPLMFAVLDDAQKNDILCELAVALDGTMLAYVPEPLKTPMLCGIALYGKNGGLANFSNLPDAFKTYAMCLEVVTTCGELLQHVPQIHRSPQMCWSAVSSDGRALAFVPNPHKTQAMCLAAVANHAIEETAKHDASWPVCDALSEWREKCLSWTPVHFQELMPDIV